MKGFSKEEQELTMLLKDKIKMQYLGHFLVFIFGVLPLASLLTLLISSKHTLSNIIHCVILILAYCIFEIWFEKRFREQIGTFKNLIALSLYSSRYALKGNALSREDFEIIKKEYKKLYNMIIRQECHGYCYSICFAILKCLKKGSILFVALRCLQEEKEKIDNKDYTIHVLYVNNDWCFDTYSQRQYPLEEVLKRMCAKTFKSFDYNAVDGKTYEEFRAEHNEELKTWCQENNCYQEWLKED